jgi:hypothetical protein
MASVPLALAGLLFFEHAYVQAGQSVPWHELDSETPDASTGDATETPSDPKRACGESRRRLPNLLRIKVVRLNLRCYPCAKIEETILMLYS